MEIVFSMPHVFYPGSNLEENARAIMTSVEYLIALDVDYLKRHATPSLYDDEVCYKRTVEWEPIPAVQLRGHGDCKSLAAWRIAEYRIRGIPAKPVFRWRSRPDGFLDYHILIQLNQGRWEDPSKTLGMTAIENGPVYRRPLSAVIAEGDSRYYRL